MEWKCFRGEVAHVSTFAFHEHRPRAPHLEQAIHRGRLLLARDFAIQADGVTYVDLGCGDGGMLQLLGEAGKQAFGYDFQPTNVAGWIERGVYALSLDFIAHWSTIVSADVYIATEVLEHLTDPHGMVARIRARDAQLVCSSPFTETYESHDECHAWAWDMEGYAKMIVDAGFQIVRHETVNQFQVILASPKE